MKKVSSGIGKFPFPAPNYIMIKDGSHAKERQFIFLLDQSSMPLQKTIDRVELDIRKGDLGKARDRLLSLLSAYPDHLEIRHMLRDVFWDLQFPAMAGRYWYLEERVSPQMEEACKAFERAFGNDPLRLFLAIKFKGNLSQIEGTTAGRILSSLREQAREKYPTHPIFRKSANDPDKTDKPKRPISGIWIAIGCGVIALIGLALMIIGLITVIHWS
jgi:hypothetical protein